MDEAYLEFTDPDLTTSARRLVKDLDHVLVARTFSKIFGMAGLRVGYVSANPSMIARLKKYQTGFGIDISSISLAAASAALDDDSFIQECKEAHEVEKQKIYESFDQWGVDYVPSATSFIYFKTSQFKHNLVKHLGDQNILIRDYEDQPGFARVSIGTPSQVDSFLEACKGHLR